MNSITKDDFRYICQLSFKDLMGKSDFSRYCSECKLNVYNLDMYSEAGRNSLLREAKNKGERFCVSVSVPNTTDMPCDQSSHQNLKDNQDEGINVGRLMGDLIPPSEK